MNKRLIGKNPSPSSARDSVLSGEQPSPYELTFRVELGSNPHTKMVSESILDPLTGHPPYYPRTKLKSIGHEGIYLGKPKSHIR